MLKIEILFKLSKVKMRLTFIKMNVFSGDPAKPIDAAKRTVAKVVRTHSQATEVRNQVQCEKESGRTQSFKGDDGNFGTSKGFFIEESNPFPDASRHSNL